MPGKALYSSAHDAALHPKAPKRKRRSSRTASSTAGTSPPIFSPGQMLQPTEEQRKQLRRRQLEAAMRDQDLMPDVRREYDVDGEVTHSEPRHRAPHPYGAGETDRSLITLPEDVDTELDEEEHLRRLQQEQLLRLQMLGRVGGVTGDDPALKKVGDQIARLNQDLNTLLEAVRALSGSSPESQAVQHHTSQMQLIITTAVQPWLKELDDHAAGVVEDTEMEVSNQIPLEDDDDHPLVSEMS